MSRLTDSSDLPINFTSNPFFSVSAAWTYTRILPAVVIATVENKTSKSTLPNQYPPGIMPAIVWSFMPIIIISNLVVVLAFALKRSLRVVANYFVVSLAFSDLFSGAILIPLVLTSSQMGGKLVTFSLLTALFMIGGCTYDRYVAVSYPLQYVEKVTKPKVFVILAASWMTPGIIIIIPEIWNHGPNFQEKLVHRVYIACNAFTILIVIFGQALVYVHIFRIARRHVISIRQLERFQNTGESEGQRKSVISLRAFIREIKFAKLFALVGVLYFVFWLPIGYINLVDDVFGREDLMPTWIFTMSFYSMWLSSLVNPTLYALFTRSFKKVIFQWLRCLPLCRLLTARSSNSASIPPGSLNTRLSLNAVRNENCASAISLKEF